jgi:hypothetical protein
MKGRPVELPDEEPLLAVSRSHHVLVTDALTATSSLDIDRTSPGGDA